MNKIIGTVVAAFLLPASANAGTPQQDLYVHLVQQAGKSRDCVKSVSGNQFCKPAPVSGRVKNAAEVLRHMREVEKLGALCSAGEVNACLRQGAVNKTVEKLGWCSRPSLGKNWENVILWAQCAPGTIYTPSR